MFNLSFIFKEVECELECQNNGICAKDHNNESQCFCPPGWHGEACEKSKMPCLKF